MDVTLVNNPATALSQPLPCIEKLVGKMPFSSSLLSSALDRIGDTLQCELLRECSEETLRSYALKDNFPIPAVADREGYWAEDHLAYWITGLGDYLFLRKILDGSVSDSQEAVSLIDIGCASGRVLRHFAANESGLSLYGCDINRNNVAFIRRYLPNMVGAFQNLTVPPLPLAEHTLDLVYALSLFTHINDFEEAWLLEIRRILKPGGLAFITFHSDRTWESIRPGHFMYEYFSTRPHSVEFLKGNPRDFYPRIFEGGMPDEKITLVMKDYHVNNSNVFCTPGYIRRMWGRFLTPIRFYSKVHGTHQDGVVLRNS